MADEFGGKEMKKCLFVIFAFLMCTLLFTSFALAETDDEVQSALRDAGITDEVQLTRWDDTAVCFAALS